MTAMCARSGAPIPSRSNPATTGSKEVLGPVSTIAGLVGVEEIGGGGAFAAAEKVSIAVIPRATSNTIELDAASHGASSAVYGRRGGGVGW